jgi:hypothetical protein
MERERLRYHKKWRSFSKDYMGLAWQQRGDKNEA